MSYYKNITMNNMINNYNEFLNEKLTDNLKGFDADEIRNQFLNDEIEYKKYIQICKKNNIKINVEDFKQKFLSGEVDIDIYINLCKDYNYELPSSDIIHTLIKNSSNFQIMLFYACKYNFIDLIEYSIKNGADINWETNSYIVQIIKNNNIDALKLMIDNGAKISTEIIQYAKRWSYNEIADFLQNYYDNQFVTEKLTDNLKGFDADELKQQFIDGKLDFYKYIRICKTNNILPSNEEIKQLYLDNKIDDDEYLDIWFEFCNKKPLRKDIYEAINNLNDCVDMLYFAIIHDFLDLVKKAYLKCDKNIIDNISINTALGSAIKTNNTQIVNYLLKKGFKIYNFQLNYTNNNKMKELLKKYINKND